MMSNDGYLIASLIRYAPPGELLADPQSKLSAMVSASREAS